MDLLGFQSSELLLVPSSSDEIKQYVSYVLELARNL